MRTSTLIAIFMLACSLGTSVEVLGQNLPVDSNWELFKTEKGIQFFKQKLDCNLPNEGLYAEYFVLKVVNTTPVSQKVSWKNELFYDGKCSTLDTREYKPKTYLMKPGEVLQGECSVYSDSHLKLFIKWTKVKNLTTLTHHEIVLLDIIPIK